MNLLICYKRCGTCKEVEKLLTKGNVPYTYREIDQDNPTAAELRDWHQQSGLPITRFYNTSGIKYRELGLAEKRKSMSEAEQYELLATDGMIVKRPIFFYEDKVYVGPDVKKLAQSLLD